jgi:hypothetical protein
VTTVQLCRQSDKSETSRKSRGGSSARGREFVQGYRPVRWALELAYAVTLVKDATAATSAEHLRACDRKPALTGFVAGWANAAGIARGHHR